jgi:predicted SprT family Zn-dependent metalloprotease
MAVDDIIEEICDLADEFRIRMAIEDRKGGIHLGKKIIHLNPVYKSEYVETFVHEMLHYYYHNIECINLGSYEEEKVENDMKYLLENRDNRFYVRDYLLSRRE